MDQHSEERLANVWPKLAEKVRKMAEILISKGIEIRVTQGLRTWPEQQALWQKGRDAEGQIVDKALVVTNAKPGYGWHNFGLAVDVVPDDASLSGFQADWNASHPAWGLIIGIGESLGLTAGAEWRTFPDWPHFQLTGRFSVTPDDEVRYLFREGGLDAVWKAAEE